jgi:mannose-1-phosphate guanylyltransferase
MAGRRVRGEACRAPRDDVYLVIMAGGQSTRFWPLGRRRVPKQFLAITGRHSLLQETARRLVPLVSWRRLLIVTSAEHAAAVRQQLPRVPPSQVLVEPVGRNTAACIALAAEWIAARGGDAIMAVVPADHVIKDAGKLRRSITAGAALARRTDSLVLLGVRPTRPETGYGYIEIGDRLPGGKAFTVRRFHEKPSVAVARRYVSGRRHLWNSGMFVWRTSVFRAALKLCMPDLHQALDGTWSRPAGGWRRLQRVYRGLPSVSVDVGILQPLSVKGHAPIRILALAVAFDWFDVGSWGAMPELWGCDAEGNASIGKLLPIDAGNCIVYAPERLVALVGVKDLIVADSGGALLVCARQRAQEVRNVVSALKRRGWSRYV